MEKLDKIMELSDQVFMREGHPPVRLVMPSSIWKSFRNDLKNLLHPYTSHQTNFDPKFRYRPREEFLDGEFYGMKLMIDEKIPEGYVALLGVSGISYEYKLVGWEKEVALVKNLETRKKPRRMIQI